VCASRQRANIDQSLPSFSKSKASRCSGARHNHDEIRDKKPARRFRAFLSNVSFPLNLSARRLRHSSIKKDGERPIFQPAAVIAKGAHRRLAAVAHLQVAGESRDKTRLLCAILNLDSLTLYPRRDQTYLPPAERSPETHLQQRKTRAAYFGMSF
jgi:hypothetical protein